MDRSIYHVGELVQRRMRVPMRGAHRRERGFWETKERPGHCAGFRLKFKEFREALWQQIAANGVHALLARARRRVASIAVPNARRWKRHQASLAAAGTRGVAVKHTGPSSK